MSVMDDAITGTLPLGTITPYGRLRRQLETQAAGLSGHLHEFWPDIRDSGWIGGAADSWERAPYWLDGIVPLAYTLEDERLIEIVERWIGFILDHQHEDGWLGPKSPVDGPSAPNRDPWPQFIILKALTQFAEVRHEDGRGSRTYDSIVRALQAINTHIDNRPLFDWGQSRWADLLVTILWCRKREPLLWLDELAERLHNQGYDWRSHFERFSFVTRSERWTFDRHVVNNAMGIKALGLWELFATGTVSPEAVLGPIDTLDQYHGQANGVFSGDECLAGRMPSQGTELCAVVEYLYSLEQLLPYQPDVRISDRLERVVFNALPAPFTSDMWAHQYVQQVNQAQCVVTSDRIYTTNDADANIYGLEPHFGCCTANMHQGYPKLANTLWVKSGDHALRAVTYAPCSVSLNAVAGFGKGSIRVETDYPMRSEIRITVDVGGDATRGRIPAIELPIPHWAEGATLSMRGGEPRPLTPGTVHRVEVDWQGTEMLVLHLPMQPRLEFRYNNAVSIYRGPMLFALQPREIWTHLRGEHPHSDWEVRPDTEWNIAVGLSMDSTDFGLAAEETTTEAGEPNVRIPVRVRQCSEWTIEQGAAAPPPLSPIVPRGSENDATLVPYASTGLRIAELPWYSMQ